jgi:hypothetical protein
MQGKRETDDKTKTANAAFPQTTNKAAPHSKIPVLAATPLNPLAGYSSHCLRRFLIHFPCYSHPGGLPL